jgi:hypothetical protein
MAHLFWHYLHIFISITFTALIVWRVMRLAYTNKKLYGDPLLYVLAIIDLNSIATLVFNFVRGLSL